MLDLPDQNSARLKGPLARLNRNLSGYFGETIDIDAVLQDCLMTAERAGWQVEMLDASPQPQLVTLRRAFPGNGTKPLKTIYLSAGIHGDEPAGPLAVHQLLREYRWPAGLEVWICPCLNPTGFALNRRENSQGTDLNRQFLQPKAEEVLAHIAWLKRQPFFDLALCLHEDWEANGFYVYELNPDQLPSLAERMVTAVEPVCPIDRSEIIEGRPAAGGIIRPSTDPRTRPDWPEAFYLLNHKTRLTYTLEAPSDFPLPVRVAALVTGTASSIEQLLAT
ncbi:MAG TPA: M14 family metallocarboxypeptidase [Clostridia bacterium]|nr:M14 family metallocarboxypeptidase [Clostridia bacterium]